MGVIRRLRRLLFNRRLGLGLLWTLLFIGASVAINLAGIRIIGNVNGWTDWLKHHAGYFLVWRLCIYGAIAYGWWRMRKRILSREPDAHSGTRLRRAEISAVLTIIALETATFLQSR